MWSWLQNEPGAVSTHCLETKGPMPNSLVGLKMSASGGKWAGGSLRVGLSKGQRHSDRTHASPELHASYQSSAPPEPMTSVQEGRS